jgi:hypothetical protein
MKIKKIASIIVSIPFVVIVGGVVYLIKMINDGANWWADLLTKEGKDGKS